MPLSESTLIAPIPSLESNNRLSLPVASLSLCFSFNLHQLMTAWPVYVKQLRTSSYVFFVCLFFEEFLLVYLCTYHFQSLGSDKHWSQPEHGTQRWSTKNTKQKNRTNCKIKLYSLYMVLFVGLLSLLDFSKGLVVIKKYQRKTLKT